MQEELYVYCTGSLKIFVGKAIFNGAPAFTSIPACNWEVNRDLMRYVIFRSEIITLIL